LGGTAEIDYMELMLKVGIEEHSITTNIEGFGVVSPFGGTVFTGDEVTFNTYPDTGWEFQGWTGDIVSSENPLTITVTSDLNITATFVQDGLSVDENNLDNAFTVFPNPNSQGVFNIISQTPENWEIYAINGIKILSGDGNIIDVSRFSKGMYIVKIRNTFKKLLFY
jgi:hypothetical protein